MMILVVAAIAVGGLFMLGDTKANAKYPDIDPKDQGGTFTTKFDPYFMESSWNFSVPFALIKAHAIRESSLNSQALGPEKAGRHSYGLMQVYWWPGSQRFESFGYSDDRIKDGSLLFDPQTNCDIGAHIIKDNLSRFGNLRDAINAYNTGKSESELKAPNNYVDDVLAYYSTLIGRKVL